MEVYAEGNTLVYDCIYDVQIDLSDETVKESIVAALEEACESNSTTYTDIVEALREVIDADDICVRLVYRNADERIIYTHEYN